MNCSSIFKLFRRLKARDLLLLSALLVYAEKRCIGRVSLSKELSVSERTARRLINDLRERGILVGEGTSCLNEELVSAFQLRIETVEARSRKVTVCPSVGSEVVEYVDKRVVALRDYIVLNTGDPSSMEVVGYFSGSKHVVPKLPSKLVKEYLELLKDLEMSENTLFVVWRKYSKYYYEAALLASLFRACLDIYGEQELSAGSIDY